MSELDFLLRPVFKSFKNESFHQCEVEFELDVARLRRELKPQLFRSVCVRKRSCNRERVCRPGGRMDRILIENDEERETLQAMHEGNFWSRHLLFKLPDGVWLHVATDQATVYAPSERVARQQIAMLTREYALAPDEPKPVFALISSSHGFDTTLVELDEWEPMDREALELHYGPDFPAWEETFSRQLESERTGFSLFPGPPGTGKTTFIRHLMRKFWRTHRFYYIPAAYHSVLSSPDAVEFWALESRRLRCKRKVVVMEDAESIVVERNPENRAATANLLNITDGLLGEFLRLQVICTVNCGLDRLDPALIRPGRLVGFREFNRMPSDGARRLQEKLGVELPSQADYSLAELYHARNNVGVELPRRAVGFGAEAA